MTHVSNFACNISASRRYKEYQVTVVTFDGEYITVYVTARTPEEASDEAASQVFNADYTMVEEVPAF